MIDNRITYDNQWESISFYVDDNKMVLGDEDKFLLSINGVEHNAEVGERIAEYFDCGGTREVRSKDIVIKVDHPLRCVYISLYELLLDDSVEVKLIKREPL